MHPVHLLSYLLPWPLSSWSSATSLDAGTSNIQQSIQRTVRFELHLTAGQVDALGAGPRAAILVNNSFTGPTLHLKQGDEVEVVVRNYLQEDTTIHFHGIDQRKTPWSDGVPGLTQGHIHPGASYRYQWTAEQPGTFFYHAHSKGQLMDGLYGAVIVDALPEVDRPFHLIDGSLKARQAMRRAEQNMRPLLLADWSQYKFDDFYHIEEIANFDLACTDAIIVNGIGSQYCLDPESLDSMTNPIILKMLQDLGEDHMTAKGCVPPIQALQGDYDVHLGKLPAESIRKCVGGRNPKGNFTVNVDSKEGWAALTFMNVGGLYPLQVSIDNHDLYVYAVDGQYIKPVVTDRVYIGNGNRISVLVKLDQEPARYMIRMANDLLNQILGGFAELAYDGATQQPRKPQPKMNYAGQPLIKDIRSFKPEEGRPFPSQQPARSPDRTFKLYLRKPGHPYGAYEWSLSGQEVYNMTAEERDPPFLFRQPDEVPQSELVLRTQVGEWIDIILETEGPFAQSHPVHKHGNKVYFLGSGVGKFPWATVEEAERALPPGAFNFDDPSYQDTFTTPDIAGDAPAVWTVVRYKVESPGAWLLHCHVQTHHAGGMGVVMLDGIDEFPQVPTTYLEWNGFQPPSLDLK
ncbi:multicopper oxidase [Colletotrichum scovillei]|uniref:Multicopper oxidase n=1 Tax=Colletotrichum scovillei TaxID=1209932 RepID=A0A9P7R5V7_9PEZI|nr:multicopper oxidase [Colletotrichum scovillei]KAF4773545.1 multicopper oxidase [Colletotrichum scovillei]KAG7048289.1 multicopper oxidase [Colletotrichum scovillei]KAG7065455.1 multicopper oxidase [Colletotrichum scovillei]KAG7068059.1 multicopper oxidase [Colletotrichum scovillei]